MTLNTRVFNTTLLAAMLSTALGQAALGAADSQESGQDKERKLIAILQSDATPQEKAMTCKRLAVYGSKEAVPALAPLLLDKELSSWARIALEAIPDASASEALRAALPKTQGRLLIAVINSIGVRRDPQAVESLSARLQDSDADVAAAAAEALGHIGTEPAAQACQSALGDDRVGVRSAAAYGAVLCAEQFLATGKAPEAIALCDRVRQANLPKQRLLEATRGAILARGSDGVPLLLEQLRSPDLGFFSIGVRTARELPGREATQTVAKELDQAAPERQIPLLLALADRTDDAVLPKVLQVAESGSKSLRATAVGLLDRFGDLACVPVMLNAATDSDAVLARTAKAGLSRMGGKEVDADLQARLRLASGKTRQVLIELAGQRRIESALPIVMRSMEDSDAGMRRAALETVGILGTEQQVGDLVRLLSSAQGADDREDIERALASICRRTGARSLPQVLPLAQASSSPAVRKIGLRALSSIGGPEALAVLKSAMNDQDESIQDEAVSLLATWPNTWPDDAAVAEPLLTLAQTGKKPAYRVQGVRGYLLLLEENKKLNNDQKVTKINDLLPYAKGAEEKRQVISVLGTLPTPAALDLLATLAQDDAVADEASFAIVKLATDRKLRDAPKESRRKALEAAVEKSRDDATKKKASDALKKL
jgi:HEAT repeat protein